ncbi:MAG: hypothetical protein Q7R95_04365 [bacterium]|nr:hypothetical protein [bacterium]
MSRIKKATLFVKGMHCASCEVLIKDTFSQEGNIIEIKPDLKIGKLYIKMA